MPRRYFGLLLLAAYPAALAAQAAASLGVGVGTVRYAGGTGFSSASFSPTLHLGSPTVAADISGSLASLPGGIWASQGRADVSFVSRPILDAWRMGAEGVFAGTSRTDGGWTAAAHGIGELLWSQSRWGFGVGAGPSGGWIANDSPVQALHTRLRAWWHPGGDAGQADWQVTVEPTRLSEGWFTDVTAQLTLTRGSAVASFWTAARISGVSPSTGAGTVFLQRFVSSSIALEVGGGSLLKEPYQGLPRARYFTAGFRLYHARRDPPPPARSRWSAFVPERRGDSLVVRVRFDDARTVEIAGDWNAWRPAPLRSLGSGQWETALVLQPGLYHFNLLVDGAGWVVPNGVATIKDELGGLVGLLLVP